MQVSEKFTASNGMQIAWMPDDRGIKVLQANAECVKYCLPESGWRVVGDTTGASGNPGFTEDSALAVALREFFLHERDQELGRWRWPEEPNIVVHPAPSGNRVRVLAEVTGESEWQSRDQSDNENWVVASAWYYKAARAYFAANPLPKPAWHDAKPGEVWVVAMTDIPGTLPLTVVELRDGIFFKDPTDDVHILVTGQIDSARRLWPESVES